MSPSRMQEDRTEATEDRSVNADSDAAKLVPVTESIRYRKRAQTAEKQAEILAEQVAEANETITRMSEELSTLRIEQQLARKLAAAGAIDLEAAILIARTEMEGRTEADVDGCVERLRGEKGYLFGGAVPVAKPHKTAGARERAMRSQTALEGAAKKAARTGNRAHLQEYLRLRRGLL